MLGSLDAFRRRLIAWYRRNRRDLPWRTPRTAPSSELPDPYHVLVSEAMLQQTQVATVIPYFRRFLEQFPTVHALAAAEEQAVLRCWQGLGYYARARNLQRAARKIVEESGGIVPDDPALLLKIPGVGRYTAGAIASLAFGRRAPIVDGNIVRVMCRIDRIVSDPREKPTLDRLWARAEQVLPKSDVGDFNSALMELGATVCTPRNPQCLICPVRAHCEAAEAGVQEKIPAPRKSKGTPLEKRRVFAIRDADGRYLVEQRPARGRWAGMWQFVTVPAVEDEAPVASATRATGLTLTEPERIGAVTHALSHRRYMFEVFSTTAIDAGEAPPSPRQWVRLSELDRLPLPRPQLKVVQMLLGSDNGPSSGRLND